jgi:hypothetical protein
VRVLDALSVVNENVTPHGYADGLARLGQREPAWVGPLAGQQGDDGERAVSEGGAGGEIGQGLVQGLGIHEAP